MANSFELILDTTGPDIAIHGPKYTVISSISEFEILGSENLSPYQDFYFMDATGERHDVTFSFDGNSFVGQIDFSEFPEGITTFYAQVKDEVFNLSPVVIHSINVKEGSNVDVELDDQKREIKILDYAREMISHDFIRFIKSDEWTREMEAVEQKRNMDMQESTRKMGVESDG